jgi:hypothetical protein
MRLAQRSRVDPTPAPPASANHAVDGSDTVSAGRRVEPATSTISSPAARRNAGRDLSEEREDEPAVRLRDVDAEQLPGLGDDAAFLEDLALRRLTRTLSRLDLAAGGTYGSCSGSHSGCDSRTSSTRPVSVEDDSTRTVFHARSVSAYTRGPEAATLGRRSGTNFSKFD